MRRALMALVAGSLLLSAERGLAQEIDNIGNQGQVVFGVDRTMGVVSETWTVEQEEEWTDPYTGETNTYTRTEEVTQTHVALFGSSHFLLAMFGSGMLMPRLALDFFPVQGLSLGGSFMFMSSSGEQDVESTDPQDAGGRTTDLPTFQTLLVHPRIGYAIQANETIVIWPRVGITWVSLGMTDEDSDSESSLSALELTLEGMVGISPIEHFAFLIGPFGEIGLSGSRESEYTNPIDGTTTTDEDDFSMNGFGLSVSVVGYYP